MRSFLDLSRYRPLVVVVGVIAATLLVLDLGVRASVGLTPPALTRAEFLSPDLLGELGGRISGVARQRDAEENPKPLAVILGLSSAREGLLPEVLEASDPGRRWLNLGGSGGSFYELAYYLRPLFWSPLAPQLIVLAVHPVWMAGRTSSDDDSDVDDGSLKARAKRASWLVFNRNRLNIRIRRALTDSRERLFLGVGLPLDALFVASTDPWTVRRIYEGHASEQFLAKQLHRWQSWRWFDPSRYKEDDTESASARDVIEACQRKATRVVIVLMPETTALRTKVPAEAEAAFRRVLAALPHPPPVIDLRDSMPDDVFYDRSHMSGAGRPLISKLLGEKLRGLEPLQ